MAGPIGRAVYKAKGEPGVTVGALWGKEWPDGGKSYSFNPKAEADEYGSLTFEEASALVADKKGFINFYFNESIIVPEKDEDDF